MEKNRSVKQNLVKWSTRLCSQQGCVGTAAGKDRGTLHLLRYMRLELKHLSSFSPYNVQNTDIKHHSRKKVMLLKCIT